MGGDVSIRADTFVTTYGVVSNSSLRSNAANFAALLDKPAVAHRDPTDAVAARHGDY
jgi:hypothetical protein